MSSAELTKAKHLVEAVWKDSSLHEKNYARAQEIIRGVLEESPNDVLALTCLGALLSDQGQYVLAEKYLSRAMGLGSQDGNTFYNLAVVTAHTGTEEEAVRLFEEAGKREASEYTWDAYFDPQAM